MNLNDILSKYAKAAAENMAQHGKTSSLGGLCIGTSITAFERGVRNLFNPKP